MGIHQNDGIKFYDSLKLNLWAGSPFLVEIPIKIPISRVQKWTQILEIWWLS